MRGLRCTVLLPAALPLAARNLRQFQKKVTEFTLLMQFEGTEQAVLSGFMRGAAETRRRPAIVDEPEGRGRVVLFATNPCYRWQNLGEFNMLVNAILHFNHYPGSGQRP